ncbi:rifin [Plasmodium reichenowi]|uniref:Rifin n=1 Tax=Plasmodium reichenowi TaxID=5854 RepID=A0A060RM15_PLARE|nr:rifin [Plasmodium reichenowi]
MKLHYPKILLFALPITILLTLYHEHNKNKPYITRHHTQTNRSLCECDLESSIYDKDADMKSVKEIFDRRTSQRLREYDERMQDKRQKRKEDRDKNIQKIVEKDKMDKSLAEKVEKGCLRCGCALGGVAASVGLFGGLGIYGWKTSAIAAAAKAKGAKEGVKILISSLNTELRIEELLGSPLKEFITTENYLDATIIIGHIEQQYKTCFATGSRYEQILLYSRYKSMSEAQRITTALHDAKISVGEAVEKAREMTISVTKSQMASLEADELSKITTASTQLYSAIGYSVLAIVIIILIMVIMYLILRRRRKKKMNKKAQYTKLLNQ